MVSPPDRCWPWSEVRLRALDSGRPYKPLDVGEDGLAASVDATGRLVVLGQVHRAHGWVIATAATPLKAADRFDQAAVRRYRASLSGEAAASFGIGASDSRPSTVPGGGGRAAWLASDALPVTPLPGRRGWLLTVVPSVADTGGARGLLQVAFGTDGRRAFEDWRARFRLDRAELPELTEVHPLPPVQRRPQARIDGDLLVAEEPALPWALAVGGDLVPEQAGVVEGDVVFAARARLPGSTVYLGVGDSAGEARAAVRQLADLGASELVERALQRWRRRWTGMPDDLVLRRGLGYVATCCAARVGDAVALVTDHRLLPLVWTRDGYYAARTLLGWWTRTGDAEPRELVRGHLAWLFEVAVRPEGWWARSHLANGDRKDDVFQLDQQLYPLLELAEYVEATGDREPLARWGDDIERVLRSIRSRRSADAPLYATDETAADDPTRLPYILANHILLVRSLQALRELGCMAAGVLDDPDAIRRAVRSAFVIDGPGGRSMFAYACDGRGSAWAGHDANDFPLVLAPAWGFTEPDDPVWRATVEFAFSEANPAFFVGRHGGLGSPHTPGPWPLGDVQARLLARLFGDGELERRAAELLDARSYWDGALPEASDAETARPISRPWFAWPGAAWAALELEALP